MRTRMSLQSDGEMDNKLAWGFAIAGGAAIAAGAVLYFTGTRERRARCRDRADARRRAGRLVDDVLRMFAVPGVSVVHSAQSVAALFVSWPSGLRHRERTVVFESETLVGSTVPSTRLTRAREVGQGGRGDRALVAERVEHGLRDRIDDREPSGAPFWI